jgi:hypothetical protein
MIDQKSRYVLLLLVIILTGSSTYAQFGRVQSLSGFDERPIHFGFFLGVNAMDFGFRYYPDPIAQNPVLQLPENEAIRNKTEQYYRGRSVRADVDPITPGFSVGIVSNFRLAEFADLRITPGMSFGSRQLVYNDTISPDILSGLGPNGLDEKSYLNIPSTYIDIPVGVRLKGKRYGNLRPYIYLGGTYRIDLENKRAADKVLHMYKTGAYVDFAMGLDSYLQFFRLSTEFRVSFGVNNLIDHSVGTDENRIPYYGFAIEKLTSNVFSLIFYFE